MICTKQARVGTQADFSLPSMMSTDSPALIDATILLAHSKKLWLHFVLE